jgi:hypothetical protein
MPSDRGTTAHRDAGLRRVSRLTRWLLAGALALTAGFSAIAARSFSGTSGSQSTNQAGGTTTTTDGSSQSGDSSSSDSGSSDSGSTLQSPFSSPSAGSGSGSVTSGGS